MAARGQGGRLAPGLSVTDYAKHRGVSRQAVYKALRNKWITKNAHNKIDPYVADQAWDRATARAPARHQQARNGPPTAPPSPRVEYRERLDKAKAQQAELALLERRGALVKAGDVALLWQDVAAMVRRRLRQMPARIADRLAAARDENEVRRILEGEVDAVLTSLADDAPGLAQRAKQ